MSKKEIDAIKSRIGDLRAKLARAKDDLNAAELKHAGLKVGDHIMVGDKFVGKVVGWDLWPTVNPIKKDGTASKATRRAYKWRHLTEQEPRT